MHTITRTKNDQLSVDGAKLDGNLKAEVPYKSMGSIGGGKGGARGLKPPLGLVRGGLAPPQNDITPKLSFLEWG